MYLPFSAGQVAKSMPILIRMSLCASWREGRPCEELSPPKILTAIFTSLRLFQHATDLFGERVTVKTRFSHVIPLTIIRISIYCNGASLLSILGTGGSLYISILVYERPYIYEHPSRQAAKCQQSRVTSNELDDYSPLLEDRSWHKTKKAQNLGGTSE